MRRRVRELLWGEQAFAVSRKGRNGVQGRASTQSVRANLPERHEVFSGVPELDGQVRVQWDKLKLALLFY